MKAIQVSENEIAARNNMTVEEVRAILEDARDSLKPVRKTFKVRENGKVRPYVVIRQSIGHLKTMAGNFWEYLFDLDDEWRRYSVLVKAKIGVDRRPIFQHPERITLRIDSGCDSGQRFGDLTCDCSNQLYLAMKEIGSGEGIIVNIPHQDGRGKGLAFKLATLVIQERLHLNTVEAASILADDGIIDRRTYGGVIAVLRFLGITSRSDICIATNNPEKCHVFGENGFHVAHQLPIVTEPTEHTRHHLLAKQRHLGHRNLVTGEELRKVA